MKGQRAVIYSRVSTSDQDVAAQVRTLSEWSAGRGWQVVAAYADRVTGDERRRKGEPPGLRRALAELHTRRADVLVVFAADRLVRSPTGLLQLVARVQQLGAHVASYTDGADLDTTTDVGELFLFLRGWWARMELRLNRARTLAGLARARAEGRRPGPKRLVVQLPPEDQVRSWRELGAATGVSASTARRRYLERAAANAQS